MMQRDPTQWHFSGLIAFRKFPPQHSKPRRFTHTPKVSSARLSPAQVSPAQVSSATRAALRVGLLTALAAMAAFPGVASAEDAFTVPAPPFMPSWAGAWMATVGVQTTYAPKFDGARTGGIGFMPIINIQRAGSAEGFVSSTDSPISIALIDLGGLSAGVVGKLIGGRKERYSTALNGLGNTRTAFELGGFIEYFPFDWLRLRNETRAGIVGYGGVVSDFSADFIVPVTQSLVFSGGPRFTYQSGSPTAAYFSISAMQAAASGLSAFDAKGGAHTAGVGGQVKYRIDPQWEVHSYVGYDRLLGDAAKSPLVAMRGSVNQVSVGIGTSWSFNYGVR